MAGFITLFHAELENINSVPWNIAIIVISYEMQTFESSQHLILFMWTTEY